MINTRAPSATRRPSSNNRVPPNNTRASTLARPSVRQNNPVAPTDLGSTVRNNPTTNGQRPSNKPNQPANVTRTSNFNSTTVSRGLNNSSGVSVAPRGRPKRCLNCRKMIASEAYNQHFSTCYRFHGQDPQQTPSVPAQGNAANNRNNSRVVTGNGPNAGGQNTSNNNQKNAPTQKNESFRIKKVANNINSQVPTGNSSRVEQPPINPASQKPSSTNVPNTSQMQPPVRPNSVSSSQSKSEAGLIDIQNVQEIPAIRNIIRQESARSRQNNNQRNRRPSSSSSSSSSEGPTRVEITRHQHFNQPANEIIPREESEPQVQAIRPPAPVVAPQQSTTTQNPPPQFTGALRNQQDNPLIVNTAELSQMINSLAPLRSNTTVQDMLRQLQQLNSLGRQINTIGMIGHALGESYIIERIRALQSVFIREIGEAILRSLSTQVMMEATFIVQFQEGPRGPAPFTPSEIQQYFPSERSLSFQPVNCSVCLIDINKYDLKKKLRCGHEFHPNCVTEWLVLKTTCPMCRQQQREAV